MKIKIGFGYPFIFFAFIAAACLDGIHGIGMISSALAIVFGIFALLKVIL